MFDLTRLTEFVGDLFGQGGGAAGVQEMLQTLGDHGIDLSQLEGLAPGQLIDLLAENGIELSQLDASQLSQLSDQLNLELPMGDVIETFLGKPPLE